MQCGEELTVGFEASWFTIAAASLIDGLDKKDITGSTLKPMHGVMILLDVGHDHPTVH